MASRLERLLERIGAPLLSSGEAGLCLKELALRARLRLSQGRGTLFDRLFINCSPETGYFSTLDPYTVICETIQSPQHAANLAQIIEEFEADVYTALECYAGRNWLEIKYWKSVWRGVCFVASSITKSSEIPFSGEWGPYNMPPNNQSTGNHLDAYAKDINEMIKDKSLDEMLEMASESNKRALDDEFWLFANAIIWENLIPKEMNFYHSQLEERLKSNPFYSSLKPIQSLAFSTSKTVDEPAPHIDPHNQLDNCPRSMELYKLHLDQFKILSDVQLMTAVFDDLPIPSKDGRSITDHKLIRPRHCCWTVLVPEKSRYYRSKRGSDKHFTPPLIPNEFNLNVFYPLRDNPASLPSYSTPTETRRCDPLTGRELVDLVIKSPAPYANLRFTIDGEREWDTRFGFTSKFEHETLIIRIHLKRTHYKP